MRLFLYGTLLAGAETPMARWLSQRIVSETAGRTSGAMIAVRGTNGWFPALIPGTGTVHGCVVEARLGPGELARLDRYEGREYRRVVVRVRTGAGLTPAQAWVWRLAPPAGSCTVADGDFLNWLLTARKPALSSRNGL